jgi:hypothetical protein
VGAITGYSSKDVGMSEKVHGDPESILGIPTTFLMRDILQYDNNTADALKRITEAERTTAVWLGIGDPSNFYIVDYYKNDVYDWRNYTNYGHIITEDFVYTTEHEDGCFLELYERFYGNITAENVVRYFIPMEKTGDMHSAVYDMAKRQMYIATSTALDEQGKFEPSWSQPFLRLDLEPLFNMKNQKQNTYLRT